MDPIVCCLLGICCPPLQRRQKIAAYIAEFGIAPEPAEKLADSLIDKIDHLVNGLFLKQIIQAVRNHK